MLYRQEAPIYDDTHGLSAKSYKQGPHNGFSGCQPRSHYNDHSRKTSSSLGSCCGTCNSVVTHKPHQRKLKYPPEEKHKKDDSVKTAFEEDASAKVAY